MTEMEQETGSIKISTYFNEICRLCLNKGELQMLKNLECDFIQSVFNLLEFLIGRELPQGICEQCFKDLTQMALFIRKCKHSQNILKQIEDECAKMNSTNPIHIEILDGNDISPKEDEARYTEESELNHNCEVEDIKLEPEVQLNEDYLTFGDFFTNSEDIQNELENNNTGLVCQENTEKLNEAPKICRKCGAIVVKFKDHYKISKHCQPRNIRCTDCNMSFTKTERLKAHQVAHHWTESFPRFMCHICPQMFKYEVNLKRHIEVHEKGKRFVCETCGKSYTTKIQLEDHINLHTGLKPYACDFCDKKFSMRAVRSIHQKKHLQDLIKLEQNMEPVFCEICEKPFSNLRALGLHVLSHDENRIFKCSTCQREFASRLFLLRHAKVHSSENYYSCTHCSKSFKARSYLATHMRSHTGERPFVCTECPKAFTQRTHLSYHMLLHKNEKSFGCKFCGKKFTLKGNLTVHIRIHTGERPYKCGVCELAFRDASARKRHVISKHGREQVAHIQDVDTNEI